MKKISRRDFLKAAALSTAVVGLSGCGAAASSAAASSSASGAASGAASAPKTFDNVTLHMWGGVPAENGPQAACDAFNEEYKDKGIQCEYERFVNDETGNVKLETNLMGGSEIDVYMSYGMTQVSKRAEGNMALDLTELCTRDNFDLESYLGDMVEAYYLDGKAYCIPCKRDQYGMVLNKDMFDAAGIEIPTEWTYEEFMEAAKKLTSGEGQDKVYGCYWNSQQDMLQYANYLACQTLGGNGMYTSDGKASNFTDPVWEQTIGLINDTMQNGYAPTHADSVTEKLSQESMFLSGKCAMTIGPWMVRNIKDTATYPHTFVTAFAPYPVCAEGERKYTQGGYGDLLSINPQSENVDAAWEFAKWYLTKGGIYLAGGGRVPAANTYNSDDVTKAFVEGAESLFDAASTTYVLLAVKENYAVQTITTKSSEITDVANEDLEAIYNGKSTVEDGLLDAKTRADAILAQA
ncbi:MAG: substrate-binding domain-containing protein [Faecalibacterium sp.]|jgi:multiple sugar transport system substrate-binding protein|nr:substrate-binding domain-containing protein [Faecalibacterium sp.]